VIRLFGIETEYGIARDDLDTMDPVVESMELVRAHLTRPFERRWDYASEDPHEDARGFRVSGLAQDKEEAPSRPSMRIAHFRSTR
jgi:proteasome accessory factor A